MQGGRRPRSQAGDAGCPTSGPKLTNVRLFAQPDVGVVALAAPAGTGQVETFKGAAQAHRSLPPPSRQPAEPY